MSRGFEKRRRKRYEKYKIDKNLRDQYGVPADYKNKIYQYSKILTTIILTFTVGINAFYFLYVVPISGSLMITDAAMQYSAIVLKVWDTGTVLLFCGYFAKALFETKFEKETEYRTAADSQIEIIQQEMNEVLDETNY